MNRPTSKEIELVIQKLLTTKYPGPGGFDGKFYQTFKEKLTPTLHKFSQRIEEEVSLLNSFFEAIISLTLKPEKDITRNYRPLPLMTQTQKSLTKCCQTESSNILKYYTP